MRPFLFLLSFTYLSAWASEPAPWKKSEWLEDAFQAIRAKRYPRLKAISYWHDKFGETDLRINSSPESLRTFRKHAADPLFISFPQFAAKDGETKLQVSKEGIYYSAFPELGGTEDVVSPDKMNEFETLSGRLITWAYFSSNWINGIRFPRENVKTITDSGRIPFLRIMMRSSMKKDLDGPDPLYSLDKILDGKYDSELRTYAKDAKAVPTPMIVEIGTEVNGDWFPWNGKWNGEAKGPEKFKAVYRKIVELFRKEGVRNVTWVYHVDAHSSPVAPWNKMANYYPGDDYVDWIGISTYGPSVPSQPYETFTSVMDKAYPELAGISSAKPLALLEWGVTENAKEALSSNEEGR